MPFVSTPLHPCSRLERVVNGNGCAATARLIGRDIHALAGKHDNSYVMARLERRVTLEPLARRVTVVMRLWDIPS